MYVACLYVLLDGVDGLSALHDVRGQLDGNSQPIVL